MSFVISHLWYVLIYVIVCFVIIWFFVVVTVDNIKGVSYVCIDFVFFLQIYK
jgi:hypothetical protein